MVWGGRASEKGRFVPVVFSPGFCKQKSVAHFKVLRLERPAQTPFNPGLNASIHKGFGLSMRFRFYYALSAVIAVTEIFSTRRGPVPVSHVPHRRALGESDRKGCLSSKLPALQDMPVGFNISTQSICWTIDQPRLFST